MIRWRALSAPHGRYTIGLGLEAGNIERLMNGKPIFVKGETVGFPGVDIYIHYGKTKEAMIEELRAHGVSEELIDQAESAPSDTGSA